MGSLRGLEDGQCFASPGGTLALKKNESSENCFLQLSEMVWEVGVEVKLHRSCVSWCTLSWSKDQQTRAHVLHAPHGQSLKGTQRMSTGLGAEKQSVLRKTIREIAPLSWSHRGTILLGRWLWYPDSWERGSPFFHSLVVNFPPYI